MFRRHKTFNILYLLILLLNVYALSVQNQLLKMVAMPLIGTSLMFYLILKTKIEDAFQKLIFIGVVFSLAGDVQSLFTTGSQFYFLTALLATLASYLFYSAAFYLDFSRSASKPKRIGNIFLFILFVVNVVFFITADRNLGEFKVPVMAYLSMMALMVALSGYRYKRVNQISFKLIFTGSFAFVISDLCIGFYMFIEEQDIMMMCYLLTYLVALYLVVMGTIERKLIRNAS